MPLLQSADQQSEVAEVIEQLPGNKVNADQISSAIMQNMDEQQQQNTQHFISAGKDLLFGEGTHYQIMDSLKNSTDLVQDFGFGAYQLMMTMIQSGGLSVQDRPDVGAVIIPAGVILMGLAAEFMNESEEFPDITLDQFGDSVEAFTYMMLKHDPEFSQSPEDPQEDIQQPMPPQPTSGALLNAGG